MWDEKLISMQDIIDVWLKVQAAWLYLEPIFSSEDIMAQMPEEGRRFRTVDGTWKKCMKCTAEDPLVLNATGQPGLLENLKKSLELLELIQKGRVQKILRILIGQNIMVILKISLRDLPTSSSKKTDWLIGFYGLDLV